MAAVNFPNSPSVNDTHTSSGSTWKWDGTVGQRLGAAGAQGAQGAQGRQGAGGAAGAQGAQGVQGANGAAGAQGAQGVQGAANATTINNNANNRIITGSGTANTLEAESDFTWDDSAKRLVVGSQIVRIGDSAGSNSGTRSTTVGNSAGNNSGSYSVNIGNNTGSGAGSYSVNIGANSVGSNAGQYSVSIGGNAVGYSNPKTGSINIGSQFAGYSNAGEHCINIGYSAGYNSGGKYGVNIGYSAGHSQGSSNQGNVAIGYHALKHENGNEYCVGIGNSCYLPIKGESTGASDNQLVIGVGHTAWIVGNKSYNIGLGVTNPKQQLHVHSDTAYEGIFVNGNAAPTIGFGANTATTPSFKVGIPGTNNTWFGISTGAANANKFTMNGSGLSGFTHNPDTEVLTIGGGQRWTYQSNNWGTGTEGAFIDYYASGSMVRLGHVNGASGSAKHIVFYSGGTERFRITSTGQLQATSAADVRLTLGSSGTAGTNNSVHIRADSADLKFMAASGGSTLFEVNGTETFRIASDGRLLIGAQKSYSGQGYYDDITINNSNTASGAAGGTGISLISGNNTWGALLFGDSDDDDVGYIKYSHMGNYMRFATDGGIRFRIDSDGVKFNGDTSSANGLDDYEEGLYNPSLTCASGGGYNLSSSYNTMAYRKIGSLVHIQGYIAITSESGTPNGTLRISLPFSATALQQNADYTGFKILIRNHGSNNMYNQIAVCHGGGSYFNVLFDDGNGGSTYVTHAYVDTDWQFFISGSYIGG